jgi:hypothetical protein
MGALVTPLWPTGCKLFSLVLVSIFCYFYSNTALVKVTKCPASHEKSITRIDSGTAGESDGHRVRSQKMKYDERDLRDEK